MPVSNLKFLLVEDDDDHAELIRIGFYQDHNSHTLVRVSDGEEAIDYLKQNEPYQSENLPDVILLDLKLPKLDGHQVLEKVKADPEIKHIPVVILTTSQTQRDRELAYKHQANSYLIKPLDFGKFHTLMKDLSIYWGFWNEIVKKGPPA